MGIEDRYLAFYEPAIVTLVFIECAHVRLHCLVHIFTVSVMRNTAILSVVQEKFFRSSFRSSLHRQRHRRAWDRRHLSSHLPRLRPHGLRQNTDSIYQRIGW